MMSECIGNDARLTTQEDNVISASSQATRREGHSRVRQSCIKAPKRGNVVGSCTSHCRQVSDQYASFILTFWAACLNASLCFMLGSCAFMREIW